MLYKINFVLLMAHALPMTHAVAADVVPRDYPSRPIRIIVPQIPGGTADTVARTIAPGLAAMLGQQMVIDNRGGAGGIIGTEMAAKAVPDGYTLSFNGAGPITVLPNIQKQTPYDPIRDFAPVSLVTISPFALVVHPSVPVKSVKELVAHARAEPGRLHYASAGTGSVVYLGMEMLKRMAGVNMLHVPYKGSAQGLTDVLAGHVAAMLFAVQPVLQHAAVDRLRILDVTSAKRSPQRPDIPTIAEAGFPGYEVTTWTGLFVPAKTPPHIAAKLHDVLGKVIRAPDTRQQLEMQGMDIIGSTPEVFAVFVREELVKYSKIINSSVGKAD